MLFRSGHYMPRSFTGIGSAVGVHAIAETTRTTTSTSGLGTPGSNLLVYPAPADGGLHLQRMFIGETDAGLRGLLRGIWFSCHERVDLDNHGIVTGTQVEGSSGLLGKTFEKQIIFYSGSFGCAFFEISDTFETMPS